MSRSIEEAVEAAYSGERGSARKTGRNPKWPYVPVIECGVADVTGYRKWRQVMGIACATREEAVARAERRLEAERSGLADRLANPRNRSLRRFYDVPEPEGATR
jgi:hypothetical protein